MSIITSFVPSTAAATSTAPTTSTTSSSSSSNNGSADPGTFYKNLFYILIGLLAAFGLVSFLSLMRARKRRNAIIAEANRLGVLVPGIPGYIPLRERNNLQWTFAGGSSTPDWWEVVSTKFGLSPKGSASAGASEEGRFSATYTRGGGAGGRGEKGDYKEDVEVVREKDAFSELEVDGLGEFHPLALIPTPLPAPHTAPLPPSSLPYFPVHLAYLPSQYLPPPARFTDPDSSEGGGLDGLVGERLGVVTLIQMPSLSSTLLPSGEAGVGSEAAMGGGVLVPGASVGVRTGGGAGAGTGTIEDDEDPEEVIRYWGGVEFGILDVGVVGKQGWNGE